MSKLSSLAVGSTVKLNVDSTSTEFIVVHQGKPSSLYDDTCNGTWLLMKNIYENKAWDSSNNDLYNSDIHAYLNGTFLAKFDSTVQSYIKQVKIPYKGGTGSSSTAVQSGSSGLSCKLFLLSGYELGWTTSNSSYFPIDGAKLDYFESGIGSSANTKRVATLNGSAAYWWTRSPHTNNTGSAWGVYSGGSFSYDNVTYAHGLRPALILDSGLSISDDGTVKKETSASVTLKTPLTVSGTISVASLSVQGSIPGDATLTASVTNNAKDSSPTWQDCTKEVKNGTNIVFSKTSNTNGAAFNFKVSVTEGTSGEGGYISSITGAFQ